MSGLTKYENVLLKKAHVFGVQNLVIDFVQTFG